ncbi:hypothetical protein CCACVL1_01609 [Corchorus capsularis]|uniref:Uncharacterized protein n=1 Tax=Corchorus capsularis TaxID=210143 RepID=A0A1R3KGZ3_COCAP|nr:hypothetical protein CCACVL1_01609 [Corchorus capsularis]
MASFRNNITSGSTVIRPQYVNIA